jgi:hypothetical protein
MKPTQLGVRALRHLADFHYSRYFLNLAKIPEPVSYEDLFAPTFWRDHVKRLKVNDVIRVRGQQAEFDCELVVDALCEGGIVVSEHPKPRHVPADWHRTGIEIQATAQAARDAELGGAE